MAEAKPFASLSSGLLARKGAAKPAMRPQGFGQGMGLEDLGWNDMGYGQAPAAPVPAPEHVPSSISALTPAPRSPATDEVVAPPPVVEQQRAIQASFSPEPKAKVEAVSQPEAEEAQAEEAKAPPVPARKAKAEVVKLPPRPRSAPGSKAKAAFTLRLDAERHLKLRLACAVTHRSAQQIVSEALETFLAALPELDNIADRVPSTLAKRG